MVKWWTTWGVSFGPVFHRHQILAGQRERMGPLDHEPWPHSLPPPPLQAPGLDEGGCLWRVVFQASKSSETWGMTPISMWFWWLVSWSFSVLLATFGLTRSWKCLMSLYQKTQSHIFVHRTLGLCHLPRIAAFNSMGSTWAVEAIFLSILQKIEVVFPHGAATFMSQSGQHLKLFSIEALHPFSPSRTPNSSCAMGCMGSRATRAFSREMVIFVRDDHSSTQEEMKLARDLHKADWIWK